MRNITIIIFWLVIWGMALLASNFSNYTLFEGFVIITLSLLVSEKVFGVIDE